MKRLVSILAAFCTACASMPQDRALRAYVDCAGADIGTTSVAVFVAHRAELNPIVNVCAKTIATGGPASIVVCGVVLSILVYQSLRVIDEPKITTAAAALTCASAARNVYVLTH